MDPEFFCIGFYKTGTTSLQVALQKLGYRVRGLLVFTIPEYISMFCHWLIRSCPHTMRFRIIHGPSFFEKWTGLTPGRNLY